MLQIAQVQNKLHSVSRNWWLPVVVGFFYGLALPPFNHETHPLLFAFPFVSFLVLIPLMGFAVIQPRKRAFRQSYLYGISASATQLYWIANVNIEGLRAMIFLGLVVACLFVALYYLLCGILFRAIYFRAPRFYPIFFPAALLLLDYLRSVSEIAFPWMFLGYTLTPVLPLAQFASVSGVFGLTYLVASGNAVLFSWVQSIFQRERVLPVPRGVLVFAGVLGLMFLWGAARLLFSSEGQDFAKVSVLQTNMNQTEWGRGSLDSSMTVTENMVLEAARKDSPDLIVLPESAIFAYLVRTPALRQQVRGWADSTGIPIVVGTLHWDLPQEESYYDHHVFNVALRVMPQEQEIKIYRKMWLLPFSEAVPFETSFPILNRVNLGESDFKRGTEPVVFDVGEGTQAGPFICYEMIFPSLVRERVRNGANLLVNITNDGWFGRSSAAHHHATMSRMRAIETGTAMARSANSGISMLVDRYGRVQAKTGLYERTFLTGELSTEKVTTLFVLLGNWPVLLSFALLVGSVLYSLARRRHY